MTFSYCECGRSSAVAILVLCPLPAHIPGDPGSIPGYAKVFLASAPKAFHSSCCEYQPTMYSHSLCCEYQPTIYSHSSCCEYQPTIYSHSLCCEYQPTMYSQRYNTKPTKIMLRVYLSTAFRHTCGKLTLVTTVIFQTK